MSEITDETQKNASEVQDDKVQMDRAKTNLVYLGMFSVFMLFAGFTSAYIVMMGDNFWVKAPLPQAFWISTVIIALSSIAIQLALFFNKKGNAKLLKLLVTAAFLLGIGFVYFQFKGYGQLMENGLHFTGSGIVVSDGRYGDYYSLKMDGEHVFVNGNDYLKGDVVLKGEEMKRLQDFTGQFLDIKTTGPIQIKKGSEDFTMYYRDEAMTIVDGELRMKDSSIVLPLDRDRLKALAVNIRDNRGDFFIRGEMGKDFKVLFGGKEVTYKDRDLYYQGKKLQPYMQTKIMESADTASSFLYLLTIMHLLHIIVTLIYLSKVVIRSFTGKINSSNAIGLKMGALFWHFLGLLWVYLLLFLLFIH